MTDGYMKFYRQMQDHWIYKDSQYYHIWSDMLFRARFVKEPKTDTYEGVIYTINYGEFIYGRPSWAKRLNVGEQKLRLFVEKLLKENMIELVKHYGRRFSIYKVVNYEKYNQPENQQQTHEAEEVNEDRNQQGNQERTNREPTENQLGTSKEERKKENNNIKGIYDYYISLGLVKHRTYTDDMRKAIEGAMKKNKYDIEYCKVLLERHKKVVELTKGNEYPVPARSLTEFFGQKAYNAAHLICSEYDIGGKMYEKYLGENKQQSANTRGWG